MAHKYKIIQTFFSSNLIYIVRYMVSLFIYLFFMIYLYWTPCFLHLINSLAIEIKKNLN